MKIAITGASGMIGTALRERFDAAGHITQPVPRAANASELGQILASSEVVVHLAGEPVAQKWTEAAKKRIYDSRVEGTLRMVDALSKQSTRPRVLICASAVGYYGSRGDQILTEASSPGDDFLARLVVLWEDAAQLAEALGIRVVRLRLGMVLGHGGALAKLLPAFRYGVGGRLGSGHQWMAWIHIADVVNLVLHAMSFAVIRGAVNATAPHPVTNEEFTDRLAMILHRPAILPIPAFALKLALGEMSSMVLASQRVLPTVAKSAGFSFQYPELQPALEDLLSPRI
jgi:uncharacterized protein (TIGR01777 family)